MFDSETLNTTDLSDAPTPDVMEEMFFALREQEAEEHRRSLKIHRSVIAWVTNGEAA